jgi:hypothetical protein
MLKIVTISLTAWFDRDERVRSGAPKVGNPYHEVGCRSTHSGLLAIAAALAPFALFVAIYAPAAGQGLVRDDYTWILWSRIASFHDLIRLLTTDLGFYRPLVGLTFAANEWVFGPAPTGYGLTNVLLALGCCASVASLSSALGLPRGAALVAGTLWLLNVAAMPIGVLWISGRTELVMILAATMSATALVRGRLWRSIAWLAVSLFSKEEAVLLPFVLLAWLPLLPRAPVGRLKWAIASGATLAGYLLARTFAGATSATNAPAFYRFTFDPATVATNLGWYSIQATALSAIVIVTAAIVLGRRHGNQHADRSPRLVLCGLLWIAGGLALTVWLPVRSHLYVALPAVGAALGAAAVCADWWTRTTPARQRAALIAAIAFVVTLVPVHARAAREWITRTKFAAVALSDLARLTADLPDGASVVLADDRNDPNGNLASVFGTMANEAAELVSGRQLEVWIDPAPPHADVMGLRAPCPECLLMRLTLVNGRLRVVPSP